MHVGTRRNVLPRDADHFTVLKHWRARGNRAHGDLVGGRNVVERGDHAVGGPDTRPTADVADDQPDVVYSRHRHQGLDDGGGRGCRHESSDSEFCSGNAIPLTIGRRALRNEA